MHRLFILLSIFLMASSANATDTCMQCMEKCPHPTRDIKACDRGCPRVCDTQKLARMLIEAKIQLQGCRESSKTSGVVESSGQE